MKFEDFVAGLWVPRYQYKSFEPTANSLIKDSTILGLLRESTGRQ
jgi:hypothetical protein